VISDFKDTLGNKSNSEIKKDNKGAVALSICATAPLL
jgi:hypothetical protein